MGLSRRASQLPLTAISIGLQAWEHSRGLREFALRRGNEALQIAAHTPLGRLLPQQIFNDGADEEAARVAAEAREATRPRVVPDPPAAAKPAPQPKPEPVITEAAREVGAPGAVTQEVEELTEQLHVQAPESRDELPIPDFDNISLGSLRARIRKLSVEQLIVLREWEQAHANRLPVVTTLDNRIAKLHEEAAGTSGGGTANGSATPTDVGAAGTDYPREAVQAERAAEDEGGTLRV
jgi:hypothetical protein